MPYRTIPIVPVPRAMTLLEPEFHGCPEVLGALLVGLEALAREEFGPAVPRGAWLRCLRLQDAEAELRLAPKLGGCGPAFQQAAFELLRSRLRDTDIFITAAPQ